MVCLVSCAVHFYTYNYNVIVLLAKSFMGGVVFVNSLRNSVSLFLLLIVALGYGVVKPSLGTDMRICIGLAVAVFISVVIFNVGILVESVRDSFFLSLLCIFPLALTLSFTITRIMNALKATLVHLEARRQTYKITMYKRLRLVLAVVVSFGAISLLTSVGITGSASRDLVAWKATYMTSYWFFRGKITLYYLLSLLIVSDGWMNIIYFCGFISIILLWRPTSNNARYGLEELPEHADGGAYDLEMTTGYDSGQEMKRRNPANNNTQQSQKRNDVVFELDTENESPDELMGNNNHSAIKNAVVSDSDGGGDMSLSPTSTNGGQKLQ